MAITKSAKKAQHSSVRKGVFNARRKKVMKDFVKKAGQLIAGKKAEEAVALLPKVYQAVDKAVKRGVIKANAAARIKSRIVKRVRALAQ